MLKYGFNEAVAAVVQMCSVKKVFVEISLVAASEAA